MAILRHSGIATPSRTFEFVGSFRDSQLELPFAAYVTRASFPHDDFVPLVDAIATEQLLALWVSEASGEIFAHPAGL